jgi:hypothetical protein
MSDKPDKNLAKQAAAKLVKANLVKIEQLNAESVEIASKAIETRDGTKLNVKDQMDKMRAQNRAELKGVAKADRAAIKARQQANLKAFSDKAKSDLANLKTATRKQIQDNKIEIQKLKRENGSALSGGSTTGFYTDKNGKRRPLNAPKGK